MNMNRRTALTSFLSVPLSLSHAIAVEERRLPRPSKMIGTEEHFLTAGIIEATNRYMRKNAADEPGLLWLRNGFPPLNRFRPGRKLLNFDTRLEMMDADGIDMQILSLMQPGVQIFEPADSIAISRDVNDEIAEVVKQHPTRFAALAAIPPQSPEAAAKELGRAVKTLGMKGAIISSHTKGEYLDNERFWPIFAAAEELDVPIYLHPREPSPGIREQCNLGGLHMIWGFAAETSLHALRLIVSGLFEKHPAVKIVLGHLGEGIPYYLKRTDNRFEYVPPKYKSSLPRKLTKRPSEYFRDNFVVTSSGQNWQPAVHFCQKVLGDDKVMFGVDYPFEDQATTVAEAESIAMPHELRERFFHANAERVFKL